MFWLRNSITIPLDDTLPLSTPIRDTPFTVYDTETTGFQMATTDRLIEIGAVHMRGYEVLGHHTYQTYVKPKRAIPPEITELTGINDHKVKSAPESLDAIGNFLDFIKSNNSVALVGHYVAFDMLVLKQELRRAKQVLKKAKTIDTLDMIGFLSPTAKDMRDLEQYAIAFGTRIYERHSALGDALTTAFLYSELLQQFIDRGYKTWGELIQYSGAETRMLSF
ncbi:3'-5' exonuclease [Bacillus sp. Marseille-P3661]|uniref:3'-5' exonuclease n=1 Tax=Bacillus sp. Marseille-P3661 TaxID=1936234 RepID=UPI000C81F49E|nr:3'-5' exonuclease [Bacillus sp. Marseille-P3661]